MLDFLKFLALILIMLMGPIFLVIFWKIGFKIVKLMEEILRILE